MENRFRFRAFYFNPYEEDDCDNKKMFYDAENTYDFLNGVPASSFGDIIDSDFWTVEQCTGLKDKNGKLIYENDCVKIKDTIYKVFWNKTKISLENILKKDIIDVDITQNMEVVGNVHEERDSKKV